VKKEKTRQERERELFKSQAKQNKTTNSRLKIKKRNDSTKENISKSNKHYKKTKSHLTTKNELS